MSAQPARLDRDRDPLGAAFEEALALRSPTRPTGPRHARRSVVLQFVRWAEGAAGVAFVAVLILLSGAIA